LGEDQSVVEFHKLVFFAHRGMQAEARELLPKLNDLGRGWIGEALPAVAHGLLGQREEASRELDALLATAKERYVPAFRIAWVYAALGDADKFFEWLLRSADEMGNNPYEFISCPAFERMRADPRFQVYIRRCALTG
jgi:hypothetical protein